MFILSRPAERVTRLAFEQTTSIADFHKKHNDKAHLSQGTYIPRSRKYQGEPGDVQHYCSGG
jgi:hypothetical protein